jgi:hypothetical protein
MGDGNSRLALSTTGTRRSQVDLFRRLHADEHTFLLPNDYEISPTELQVRGYDALLAGSADTKLGVM